MNKILLNEFICSYCDQYFYIPDTPALEDYNCPKCCSEGPDSAASFIAQRWNGESIE